MINNKKVVNKKKDKSLNHLQLSKRENHKRKMTLIPKRKDKSKQMMIKKPPNKLQRQQKTRKTTRETREKNIKARRMLII